MMPWLIIHWVYEMFNWLRAAVSAAAWRYACFFLHYLHLSIKLYIEIIHFLYSNTQLHIKKIYYFYLRTQLYIKIIYYLYIRTYTYIEIIYYLYLSTKQQIEPIIRILYIRWHEWWCLYTTTGWWKKEYSFSIQHFVVVQILNCEYL